MRDVSRRTAVLLASLLASGIAATGCAPPTTQTRGGEGTAEPVYTSVDAMDDQARQRELVRAAEAEGKVVVQLRTDNVAPEIERAFESKYKVDLVILNPGRVQVVRQQVLQEARAGRMQSDAVETFVQELECIYTAENVVAPMPNFLKAAAGAPEFAREHSVETFQYPFLPAWNTDQVGPGREPTSYEDFLAPEWRDKLVMVRDYDMWYKATFDQLTGQGMTPEEFAELFREIASNASSAESSNPAANFLASGQYRAGINLALVSIDRISKKAPLGYLPGIEPVTLVPAGLGLMRDAPHPNAAMLFTQWYLTEGQQYLEKEQYVKQSPQEKDLVGVQTVSLDLDDLDAERLHQWYEAYDNLLRGKGDVLPEYIMNSE